MDADRAVDEVDLVTTMGLVSHQEEEEGTDQHLHRHHNHQHQQEQQQQQQQQHHEHQNHHQQHYHPHNHQGDGLADESDGEAAMSGDFQQQHHELEAGDIPPTRINILEERVKVDRKRFEQMLGENSTIGCNADSFFRRVMRSTNTQIMWPPKLKPGTKSKKDPHVRITGSPNSINAAKEIIFEQLDTRRNRVTLKMDVAFTDHSHIIGKGGRSIQRVMDETGCHIHFPDSNRTNTAEKSNQVSIAGSAEGVEQSRCRIREMLPITLQFDLPLNNGLHSPPTLDPQSPQLQAIQQTYGITISFRCDGSKCNNNSYFASSRIITVAVRGARSHLFGLRQGLSVLIEYLTGFRANTINVPLTMTIDVAIQHHSFIAGRANCNLRSIMQSTGAVITMPDLNITNLSCTASSGGIATASLMNENPLTSPQQTSFMTALTNSTNNQQTLHGSSSNLLASLSNIGNRKTAIVIRGQNFESVYNAWQELLGYLPLILIFDLKEGQDLDPVQVTKLMEQMRQISILVKPKQRQNTKSIVVRGPERDSRLLFEVRKQILKLDDPELPKALLKLELEPKQEHPERQITSQQQQQQQLQHQALTIKQQQNQPQQQQHQPPSPELQIKAIRAILQPNLQKARQPTPYWAGLGFSKSVSEPMIKEKLSIGPLFSNNESREKIATGPLFSSNLIDERRISYANEGVIHDLTGSLQSLQLPDHQATDVNNNNSSCSSGNNSNVNNNCATANIRSNNKISSCLRLAVFLGRIGLVQYLGIFTQHGIDLEMLFNLNENDFAELGLPYVHRRKLAIAISEVKSSIQNEQQRAALSSLTSTFDAAPGAERSRRQKAGDIWSNQS